MLRLTFATTLVAVMAVVAVQAASADPINAHKGDVFVVTCPGGGPDILVAVNGNGEFTPAHVIGSTAVFIPTAFDLTFSFTPAGSNQTFTDTDTSAKANQSGNLITCHLDAAKNTSTTPEGTFTLSGDVTGFLTPAR
jgi:hypothetical protein